MPPRELVTIGDMGAFWDRQTRLGVARHPVMWAMRRRGLGALATPIFFGALPGAVQDAAAALYHRLLSGGCTTAPFAECSAFQSAYNAAAGGSSRLTVDGKYGNDTQAGLQFVLTAASGQGGSADGLFSAPPSCFGSPATTSTPAAATLAPLPPSTPIVLKTSTAPRTGGGGLMAAVGIAVAGAAGYLGYRAMKKHRRTNPCGRMCRRR